MLRREDFDLRSDPPLLTTRARRSPDKVTLFLHEVVVKAVQDPAIPLRGRLTLDANAQQISRAIGDFLKVHGISASANSLISWHRKQVERRGRNFDRLDADQVRPDSVGDENRFQPNEREARMMAALEKHAPNAAPCYLQAIRDLADPERVSFRGVANELRAAVWEVLEALAPDQELMARNGFRLEDGRDRPTHSQKARFILGARLGRTARDSPSDTLDVIESRVAALARSLYGRSSTSSHRAAEKSEVERIRDYVDPLLRDLLNLA
jgi:hypothetical protein